MDMPSFKLFVSFVLIKKNNLEMLSLDDNLIYSLFKIIGYIRTLKFGVNRAR